jgi:hypothetical protein
VWRVAIGHRSDPARNAGHGRPHRRPADKRRHPASADAHQVARHAQADARRPRRAQEGEPGEPCSAREDGEARREGERGRHWRRTQRRGKERGARRRSRLFRRGRRSIAACGRPEQQQPWPERSLRAGAALHCLTLSPLLDLGRSEPPFKCPSPQSRHISSFTTLVDHNSRRV